MIPGHRSKHVSKYVSKYGTGILSMKMLTAALLIYKNLFKNYKMSNYREKVK